MTTDFLDAIDDVIQITYMGGVSIQSDYARQRAVEVAAAASLGLITTENSDGTYGRVWRPTHCGFLWLKSGQIDV